LATLLLVDLRELANPFPLHLARAEGGFGVAQVAAECAQEFALIAQDRGFRRPSTGALEGVFVPISRLSRPSNGSGAAAICWAALTRRARLMAGPLLSPFRLQLGAFLQLFGSFFPCVAVAALDVIPEPFSLLARDASGDGFIYA
jgi:hypothetical protein